MHWFEVDRAGLRQLVAARPKVFILYELVQNAIDEDGVSTVVVRFELDGRHATLAIEDDAPSGFRDLTHAFTLFAPSHKAGRPELRGRFNLGEKLVLALCDAATVASTTGTWHFDRRGRHFSRQRRPRGSLFTARLPIRREELTRHAASSVGSSYPATYG